MNDYWLAIGFAVLCFMAGIFGPHVRGAMPGPKPLYPMPRRMRVIWIVGGIVFLGYG